PVTQKIEEKNENLNNENEVVDVPVKEEKIETIIETQNSNNENSLTLLPPDNQDPNVTITGPPYLANIGGRIDVNVTATDNVGVIWVKYYIDGIEKATRTTPPYQYSWFTPNYTNAQHQARAVASDAAGNTGEDSIIVVVDNIVPSVSITSPAPNAIVSGNVPINVTATDSSGIQRVEYYIDGLLVFTDTSSPYSFPWDSTTTFNGLHSIKAKAFDATLERGNSAETTINVTTANTDSTPPIVSITFPTANSTYSTSNSTIVLKGTASDNDGIKEISWNNSATGLSGKGFLSAPNTQSTNWQISSTIIGVLDTGIDYTHADIVQNMWKNPGEIAGNGIDDELNGYVDDVYGYDFGEWSGDADPADNSNGNYAYPFGHGSHVAGIIAATANNSQGVSGVCQKCKVMAIKIFNIATETSIANAIQYGANNGAMILSNSWSFTNGYNSPTVNTAIDYAFNTKNVLVVFSAGNDYSSQKTYPGAYKNVLSVAATESNDKKANFSNYGGWLDVAAPGKELLSLRGINTDLYAGTTIPQPLVHIYPNNSGTYYVASGTSMASPMVSGLAVLFF
ncbi:MAG: S8 family serine peptidase, partial [Nitrosarchaeum sp.]|nr:S8 family serine peptidase [Nitrosarchaeum sp.]